MMLAVDRLIAAPSSAAWNVLVDLDAWSQWGPTVSGARLDSPHTELSLGATGVVRTSLGFGVPFVVTEFGRAVAQRREHQMRFAAMKAAAFECRSRLDQQHRLIGCVQEVRPELIGETPAPRVTTHTDCHTLPAESESVSC